MQPAGTDPATGDPDSDEHPVLGLVRGEQARAAISALVFRFDHRAIIGTRHPEPAIARGRSGDGEIG
ncbi:hypothetical protein GCM10011575_17880 [Microlunatus endophyticus]|uniref:Uncharacterized protein n=1 Tax=Microlunatus endophyticus TaxID=1716077 RepID=A0A917W3V6_9ACTN|nr:hypothetical protein GCM10011575_17880 [Microlunatus endophyticus]